jgi:Flp pilus assembly protein TadG
MSVRRSPDVSRPDVHAVLPPKFPKLVPYVALSATDSTNFGKTHEGVVGRSRRDPGQAAVLLVIVVVALTTMMLSGLAELGVTVRDRARAEAAADAAALAALAGGGQDGGAGAAARIAAANGSTLVSFTAGPGSSEVTVVVRVGDETARARASEQP